MKNTKKIISLLLSVLMIITALPLTAVNSFAETPTSGTTGDCTWSLDGTVLTISGNGDMEYYSDYPLLPWGSSITKVVIEDGVTSIGDWAFYACRQLTSVTISDSVESIGDCVFYECTSLKSITIGSGVKNIGNGAFKSTAYYNDESNWDNGILYIGNHLIVAERYISGSVEIKQGTKIIADSAFAYCESLTSITIPSSVTRIGEYAFYDTAYYNDESNWDNGILYIGNHLIRAKSDISGSVEIRRGTKTIANGAFAKCKSLTSTIIPDSITSIGDSVFRDCRSLTSITIPNSVTSIGNSAFTWCDSLTSIDIPDSVTSIGYDAFFCCKSLKSVTISNSVTKIDEYTFSNCESLTSVTIPDSVESIKDFAFYDCVLLKSVIIPDSVTWISKYAFDDCTSLTEINVSSNNANYSSENGVLFNKEKTILIRYPEGKEETEYTIPDNVTSIGNNAFCHCTSLKSVTFGSGVTSIGGDAFTWCKSLISITIPDSVTSIGNSAFYHCTSLKSVTFGSGVTSIGSFAFKSCSSLKNITIPENVKTIDEDAFGYYRTDTGEEKKINDFTIYGVSGSEAEKYANDNGFAFVKFTQPNKLVISKLPTKTTYFVDDTFDTTGMELTATYSNGDIETVTSGFNVSGFDLSTVGVKKVTVGYNGKTATFNIKVVVKPSITLSNNWLSFDSIGSTKTLTATITPSGQKITWTSSNTSVATVSDDGVVTAKGEGYATITAKIIYNNIEFTATCDVMVRLPSFRLLYISVSKLPIKTIYYVGEDLDTKGLEITLYYSNGSNQKITDGFSVSGFDSEKVGTKTITVTYGEESTTFNVTVNTEFIVSFPDVRMGDWYYDAVKYNFERGYITGYSNGTFGPSNNIQRQDFVLILARIAGANLSAYEGQNGGFSDVQAGAYYASAVAWAKDKGVVTGYSADNFGVGTYITREQISLILCRYLNGSASGDVDTILNAYSDGGNTSPWAKAGVAWAVENGIIGNSDYLNPNGNAGRAEVAQIIYNMSNKGML